MTTVAQQFTAEWLPIIEPVARKYGINPEFMLSQIALESHWGQSTPKGSNNYAGIRDFRRNSDGVMADDAGRQRKFRKFDSKEAFAEHMGSLLSRLYPGTTTAKTIEEYTHALQNGKGGRRYAEASTYQTAIGQVFNGQYANRAAYGGVAPTANDQSAQVNMRQTTPIQPAPTQQAGSGLADVMETMRQFGIQPAKVEDVKVSYDDPYASLFNIKQPKTNQPSNTPPQIATYKRGPRTYNFADNWYGERNR